MYFKVGAIAPCSYRWKRKDSTPSMVFMLILRKKQIAILNGLQKTEFMSQATAEIQRMAEQDGAPLTEDELMSVVTSGITIAQKYNIESSAQTLRFLLFWYPLGTALEKDQKLSWARLILEDNSLTETEKMDSIDFQELFG